MCKCSTACDCAESVTTISTGIAGIDGKNAFTLTTADFVQPTVGGLVTVSVSENNQNTGAWGATGQVVYITSGGYYTVDSVSGAVMILQNMGLSSNVSVGTTVSTNSRVSPAGTPGADGTNGSTILYNYDNNTGVGTPNSLLETPLGAYTLPANTLSVNGNEIDVYVQLVCTGGADGADIKLKFGGITLKTIGVFTSAAPGNYIVLKAKITRQSASAQSCIVEMLASDLSIVVDRIEPTIDLTTSNVIQITGQNTTSASLNKLVLKKLTVSQNKQ